jgi:tetratricopeptide (TPR) repeat protein/transposase
MAKKRSYSVDFKKEVIGYAQLHNIITAAEYYKLGRNTIANWIKQFKQQGTEGLVKKRRQDNQEKKLDDKLVKSIHEFKQKNPKVTLNKLKEEFNLDCSLTLLSRKLSSVNSDTKVRDLSKFKPIQSFSVYINVLSKVNIKGQTHSVYQINIEDNISHNKFIGYSLEKNSMNISLFIDYVLSNLKDKGLINSNYEIQSNIPNLKRNEIDDVNINRFVTSKHNTNLTINKDLDTSKSNVKIESDLFSHNNLIKSIYKELVLGSKNVDLIGGLSSENIIIPPIFIDSFIQDLDKIIRFTDFWKTASLPSNQNKLLLETLSEIEEYGDNAQIEFDFDTAINIYHKILLTCNNIKDSAKLRSQVNLKQGKIYYHIDNFDTSERLLEDNIEIAKNNNLYHELGESYHYMGMIYFRKSESVKADIFYKKGINAILNSNNKDDIYEYYEIEIKKNINMLNYDEAFEFVEKYIKESKSKGNTTQLSIALGLKSTIFFYAKNYEESEKILFKQRKLTKKIGNKILEAKCILAILNLYTFISKEDYASVIKLFNVLKVISKKINKESYLISAYACVGVYLGNLFYKTKEFRKAIKFYNKVKKISKTKEILMYEIYSENALGKSYYMINRYQKAIGCFNHSIKISNSLEHDYVKSNSLTYLGRIYKFRKSNKKAVECFKQALDVLSTLKERRNYSSIDNDVIAIKEELKVLQDSMSQK